MRKRTPAQTEADVLLASRRRCALCWGLNRDLAVKKGQIAHLDQDSSNSAVDNLAFLCLDHHDEYDTKRSQSKGFTIAEVKCYRDQLCQFYQNALNELEISTSDSLSSEALAVACHFCAKSQTGRQFDPQVRMTELAVLLSLEPEIAAEAVDELMDLAYISMSSESPSEWLVAENRLFWSLDAFFTNHDPLWDARTIAVYLLRQDKELQSRELAEHLAWDPRRLNPAINLLVENGFASGRLLPGGPFTVVAIRPSVKTRRFVKRTATIGAH